MTLLELLQLLRKHLKLVIALPLACALLMGLYSVVLMRDTYTASTSMYVLVEQETVSNTTLYSDLSASQMISTDVATLLSSDRVQSETAEQLGLKDLTGYSVSVTSETDSRVIGLSVTGADPQVAADIANGMVDNVSTIAREVMDVESVNAIDLAVASDEPSGPNRKLYVAVALMAGLFLAVAIVVMADMLNTKVRSQEEIEALLDVPLIGRIPAMKGGR